MQDFTKLCKQIGVENLSVFVWTFFNQSIAQNKIIAYLLFLRFVYAKMVPKVRN